MLHSRKRVLAFALALFLLLPSFTGVRATDAAAIADEPLTETPEAVVPAIETPAPTPSDTIEAETELSLSDSGVRVIKGESKSLLPEPEQTRGEAALGTSSAANPLTAAGVVWTSSDPTVATVDSTGTVTAHKLGEVTITATMDGEVIQTFTVYSSLESGYYAISEFSSLYYMPHYMCATQISMQNNVTVYSFSQDDLNADGVEEEIMTSRMLGFVWYIKQEATNVYSIRPAYSHAMVLSIFGGAALLQQQSRVTNDSWKWEIIDGDYGYVFRNLYEDDYVICFAESGSSGSILTVTEYDIYDEYQGWCFDYAEPLPGILLFDTAAGNLVKDTYGLSSMEYTVYIPHEVSVTLPEVGAFLQILNQYSTSQTYCMDFSDENVIFDSDSNTLYGTISSSFIPLDEQTITATIQRNNSNQSITFDLTIRRVEECFVLYDNAYSARYPNAINRISEHTQTAMVRFRQLGRFLDFNSPTIFNSLADMCTGNVYSTNCMHTDAAHCVDAEFHIPLVDDSSIDNLLHHKNYKNIANTTPYSTSSIYLSYIGHTVCGNYLDEMLVKHHYINGDGSGNYIHGHSIPVDKVAQVYTHTSYAHATSTTIHELGHLFDAPDHYTNADNGWTVDELNALSCLEEEDNPFNNGCIYGQNKEHTTIINNLDICEGCRRVIRGEIQLPARN